MTALSFSRRGTRRKPGYGLAYRSRCGRYELYCSDQVDGIAVSPARWLAVYLAPFGRVLTRHRKREQAEQSCNRHAKGGA